MRAGGLLPCGVIMSIISFACANNHGLMAVTVPGSFSTAVIADATVAVLGVKSTNESARAIHILRFGSAGWQRVASITHNMEVVQDIGLLQTAIVATDSNQGNQGVRVLSQNTTTREWQSRRLGSSPAVAVNADYLVQGNQDCSPVPIPFLSKASSIQRCQVAVSPFTTRCDTRQVPTPGFLSCPTWYGLRQAVASNGNVAALYREPGSTTLSLDFWLQDQQLNAQLLCNQQDHAMLTFADDHTLFVSNAPNGVNRYQLGNDGWAYTETIRLAYRGQFGAQVAAVDDIMVASFRPLCGGSQHAALVLLRRNEEAGAYVPQGYLWCAECDGVTTGQARFGVSTTHVVVQLAGLSGVQIVPLPSSNWAANEANGWHPWSQAFACSTSTSTSVIASADTSHLAVNGNFSQVSITANYAVGVGVWNGTYAAHFFSTYANFTPNMRFPARLEPNASLPTPTDTWRHVASLALTCPGWDVKKLPTISLSATVNTAFIHAAGELTVCAAYLLQLDHGFVPTNIEPKGQFSYCYYKAHHFNGSRLCAITLLFHRV